MFEIIITIGWFLFVGINLFVAGGLNVSDMNTRNRILFYIILAFSAACVIGPILYSVIKHSMMGN